jgi:hypothetical protein
VGHVSRSSGLFYVEASRTRVSQSGLKTDGVVMTGGAVTPSRRLRRSQVEDG